MPPGSKGRCTLRRKEALGFRRVRPGAEAACPLPARCLPCRSVRRQGRASASPLPGGAALPQPHGSVRPRLRSGGRAPGSPPSAPGGEHRRCHPAKGRPCLPPGRGCGDPTWKHLACVGSLCCNNGTELVILSETPLTCVPPGGVCPVPPHVLLSFGEGAFAPCWVKVVEAFVLVWNCWWLKFSVETVLLRL